MSRDLRSLFLAHKRELHAFLADKLSDPEAANDLTQETDTSYFGSCDWHSVATPRKQLRGLAIMGLFFGLRGRVLRGSASVLAIAACIGLAPSDLRSQPMVPQIAERPLDVAVPPGDLNSALISFADKAQIQIFYDPARVQGLGSNGVSGTFPLGEGLNRLLAGSGFTYRWSGPNNVTLVAVSAATMPSAAPAGANEQSEPIQLGPVRVEDNAFAIQTPMDSGYRASTIVSATRTPTALRDVPQAITVVTRSQINDQGIRSISDALRYVPGVTYAQGEANRDTPVFRGNSSTSDFFVDGLRDDTQYYRDIYNIERVEVLKGPNAMIFGRGGAGGVINRVTRQADFTRRREVRVEGGSQHLYRGTFDVGDSVSENFSLRMTGLYQSAGSYRNGVTYESWGFNPTAAIRLGSNTLVQIGYEHFDDKRVADRGIPSFQGRPLATTNISTFFGDPTQSPTYARVDAFTAAIEHHFTPDITVRNRTRYADYDKFYQNIFPGALNTAGTLVSISGYNQATERQNFINQTDLNANVQTGSIRHTILAGAEFGRQDTDNLRLTAFFPSVSPTTTSIMVPVTSPTISMPLTFAPNATDASNHGVVNFQAVYLQDQIEILPQLHAIAGIRYDRFTVDFFNRRSNTRFETQDNLWSPRVGLMYKPLETASVYASYSMTYVPRAGEQLASLSPTNQALKPEQFKNFEIGAKWDLEPNLSLSIALFQLDRSNVAIQAPNNPALLLLVDGQTTKGVELAATGNVTDRWSVIGSYAYLDGKITAAQSATIPAGSMLPMIATHSFGLWNRYNITDDFGVALGVIHQGDRYAAADNRVTLPAFTRVDAAVYYALTETLSLQLNVENLLNTRYYIFAHTNDNITPGSPVFARLGLAARF